MIYPPGDVRPLTAVAGPAISAKDSVSGEPTEHSDAECEGQSIPSGLGWMQRAATSPNSPYNDAFGEDHLLRYRHHRDKDLTGI